MSECLSDKVAQSLDIVLSQLKEAARLGVSERF
jgi:hypothetical protein